MDLEVSKINSRGSFFVERSDFEYLPLRETKCSNLKKKRVLIIPFDRKTIRKGEPRMTYTLWLFNIAMV